MNTDTPGAFHFPPGMNWSCHNHGTCCSGEWEIAVGEDDAEKIRALPLGEIDPALAARPAVRDESATGGGLSLAKDGPRCIFLTDERRCSIHATFGETAKPRPCRQFPFIFTQTPGGVYVGLSFVCPSVMKNIGPPVETYDDWARAFAPRAFHTVTANDPIELSEGLEIGWEEHRLIEERLLRLLRAESIPLEDRLIAGSVWLGMLDLFLRQARETANLSDREIIATFADSLEKTQWERILRIARRPAHSPMLHRMFLGVFITLRNSLTVRRGRLNLIGTILGNYARHAARASRVRLLPLKNSFSYKEFQRIRYDTGDPECAAALLRYFDHLIFRKELIKQTDMARGYHLLMVVCALIRWYAVGLAAGRNSADVSLDDLKMAISHVEQFYVAHSTFLDLFNRYPVLNAVFYNVVRRKNFAHSLARSPV